MNMYTYLVTRLIRFLVAYAQRRGRVVSYTHGGRLYMTRYAVWGWLTGDPKPEDLRRWMQAVQEPDDIEPFWWRRAVAWLWSCVRQRLPNIYVHQMHAPDVDTACHDHPWPWAVSWIMLGGYREERIVPTGPTGAPYTAPQELSIVWRLFRRYGDWEPRDVRLKWFRAPALNVLRGDTFHRVAALDRHIIAHKKIHGGLAVGTWTLFLAGPRARAKPWGYLVPGFGFKPHQTRHAEIDGKEKRHEPAHS